MLRLKRLAAIMVLALVATSVTPQALAGQMGTGVAGEIGTPGITGDMHTPSVAGEMQTPGVRGDMQTPGLNGDMNFPVNGSIDTPGFAGWIGTGLAAIASLFG